MIIGHLFHLFSCLERAAQTKHYYRFSRHYRLSGHDLGRQMESSIDVNQQPV
jgi:hypothetical protein